MHAFAFRHLLVERNYIRYIPGTWYYSLVTLYANMMPNDENDENDENVCCIIFCDRVDSQPRIYLTRSNSMAEITEKD